jgi:hypothetical protein
MLKKLIFIIYQISYFFQAANSVCRLNPFDHMLQGHPMDLDSLIRHFKWDTGTLFSTIILRPSPILEGESDGDVFRLCPMVFYRPDESACRETWFLKWKLQLQLFVHRIQVHNKASWVVYDPRHFQIKLAQPNLTITSWDWKRVWLFGMSCLNMA